jgi:glycerol-3-phosphate cytidylyltransferase
MVVTIVHIVITKNHSTQTILTKTTMTNNLIIGVTAGSFDLTHAGHYLMFEECKGQCDYLIAFLQTNPNIDRADKNIPVQSTHERFLQVRACKYIDEVVVYETEQDLYNLFCSVKFNKRFIGSDWQGKPYTGHDIPGMADKVVFNSRNHGFSTSSLRKRVYEAEYDKINKLGS